jgi:hypothetical protein
MPGLMAHTSVLFCLVNTVIGCQKNPLQRTSALVPGTNQSSQADKSGRPTSQMGLPALFWSSLFSILPLTIACPCNLIFTDKYTLSNLVFLDICAVVSQYDLN